MEAVFETRMGVEFTDMPKRPSKVNQQAAELIEETRQIHDKTRSNANQLSNTLDRLSMLFLETASTARQLTR